MDETTLTDPAERLRRHREKLLRKLSLQLAAIELAFCVVTSIWIPVGFLKALVYLSIPPTLLAPAIYRRTRTFTWAVVSINAPIFVLATIINILTGGVEGFSGSIYITGPIVAVVLAGRKQGFIWALGSLAVMGGLALWDLGISELHNDLFEQSAVDLVNWIVTGAILFAAFDLALAYGEMRRESDAELEAANNRLFQLLSELDEAAEELRADARQLHGEEGQEGLLTRMQTTARQGRGRIAGARAVIADMVEQYQAIDEAVTSFHESAEVVSELLESIRAITKRLDIMALNLGLEAAKAGEAGAPFSLLATDMRRLAELVEGDSKEITGKLESIGSLSDEASQASARGNELTAAGTQDIEAVSRAFENVCAIVEQAADAGKRMSQHALAHLGTLRRAVRRAMGVVSLPRQRAVHMDEERTR